MSSSRTKRRRLDSDEPPEATAGAAAMPHTAITAAVRKSSIAIGCTILDLPDLIVEKIFHLLVHPSVAPAEDCAEDCAKDCAEECADFEKEYLTRMFP